VLSALHLFEIAFPTSGLAIQVSFTQWGWLQIIAGALVFAVGLGLFTGRMWARVLGVILVSISALVNFAWATMFPVWSITLLAIDFLVLYALIAHGAEMKVAKEA